MFYSKFVRVKGNCKMFNLLFDFCWFLLLEEFITFNKNAFVRFDQEHLMDPDPAFFLILDIYITHLI